MKHYKETTIKTYANKLTNKFKGEVDYVCATTDWTNDLVIGLLVNYTNNGIKKNRYDVTIWTLDNGNINIEVYKNDNALKEPYAEIEVTSLNYAIDFIYEYITNDNNDEIETLKKETKEKEVEEMPPHEAFETLRTDSKPHNTTPTQNDDHDRIKYLMETHSFPSTPTYDTKAFYGMYGQFPSISEMYNDKCFCCLADRKGNECKGKETCGKTWKRFEAIAKPEWHNVSLATLANIDFDMLDKKRQTYLTVFRDLKQTLSYLRKCKTQDTYDTCYIRYIRRKNAIFAENKISYAMYRYIDAKLSMQNVESGVWASKCEEATGYHESRRYNKSRV